MDLTELITNTLHPAPTPPKVAVPELLTHVPHGCLVVAACFHRETEGGTLGEYENPNDYDAYWNYLFSNPDHRDEVYQDALQWYKQLLNRDDVVTASISLVLESTD